MVIEREERKEIYANERRERKEYAKRMQQERKKQEEEYRLRQEERKKKEEEKRREWEQEQLERLNVDPYKKQIEACEQLIYFCAKNKKKDDAKEGEQEDSK